MRFLVFILILLSMNLYSETIVVCDLCDIKTVKDAIKLSKDGDTILIKQGTYKESKILISKEVHIIGENNPCIDGENKEGVFIITANNFTISGLTIKNVGKSYVSDYAAILIRSSKYFTVSDLVLENPFFGILVEKSSYGLVKNNIISGKAEDEAYSGNGIHLWHCNNMILEHNNISGLRDGIYFEFVKESLISNNTSRNNLRYGLHFMFSNDDEYFKNVFDNNGAGVAVMFSKRINMHHNTFHFNWGMSSYGLLLKEIYDAQIENNIFEQNTIGINIENCSRINYTNNNFIRNGWAVKFSGGSYENIFEYNNFMNNSFDLSYSSKLNDNIFEGNYWSEYSGYDLNKDGIGDIPYRPVKLFSYVVNKSPEALILLRSLFVDIINFSEKVSPVFTPDNLVDSKPIMKKINDRN